MLKHSGRSCLSIQHFVMFIMLIAELASRVLKTVCLICGLTHPEHINRRNGLNNMHSKNIKMEVSEFMFKKTAICIAGSIRGFSRQPYREGISKLLSEIPNADIYIMLKTEDIPEIKSILNCDQGVKEFMKTIQLMRLNIKKIVFFNRFKDDYVNGSRYYSQLKNINMCFEMAESYKKYDYYMRLRPDFVFVRLSLPKNINDNVVYTGIKNDAPGSDMCFFFSKHLKDTWWNKQVLHIQNPRKLLLDYVIYDNVNVNNGEYIFGGLLRPDGQKICIWSNEKEPLMNDLDNVTLSDKSYLEKEFLDKIMSNIRCYGIECSHHQIII